MQLYSFKAFAPRFKKLLEDPEMSFVIQAGLMKI